MFGAHGCPVLWVLGGQGHCLTVFKFMVWLFGVDCMPIVCRLCWLYCMMLIVMSIKFDYLMLIMLNLCFTISNNWHVESSLSHEKKKKDWRSFLRGDSMYIKLSSSSNVFFFHVVRSCSTLWVPSPTVTPKRLSTKTWSPRMWCSLPRGTVAISMASGVDANCV